MSSFENFDATDERIRIAKRFFQTYLRSERMNVTRERMALVEHLFGTDDYVDAETLLDRIRSKGAKASRATVYRTLELLVRCGLVRQDRFGSDRARYRRSQPGKTRGQLVCGDCDAIVDFDAPAAGDLLPATLALHRFEAATYSLRFTGRCRQCRQRSAEQAT